MAKVQVSVQSDAEAFAVWIDRKGVRLIDGEGGREIPAGPHVLAWIILGNPGQKATITVKSGGATLGTASGQIAAGQHFASGALTFNV